LSLGGIERIAQRGVHILLSYHAVHHQFPARNRDFHVHVEPLALLLTVVRQSDRDPATGNLGMKALELCDCLADMLLDSVRTLDSVEYDLDRFDHAHYCPLLADTAALSHLWFNGSAMRQSCLDARQPRAMRTMRAASHSVALAKRIKVLRDGIEGAMYDEYDDTRALAA
jgi:hypothetical protein